MTHVVTIGGPYVLGPSSAGVVLSNFEVVSNIVSLIASGVPRTGTIYVAASLPIDTPVSYYVLPKVSLTLTGSSQSIFGADNITTPSSKFEVTCFPSVSSPGWSAWSWTVNTAGLTYNYSWDPSVYADINLSMEAIVSANRKFLKIRIGYYDKDVIYIPDGLTLNHHGFYLDDGTTGVPNPLIGVSTIRISEPHETLYRPSFLKDNFVCTGKLLSEYTSEYGYLWGDLNNGSLKDTLYAESPGGDVHQVNPWITSYAISEWIPTTVDYAIEATFKFLGNCVAGENVSASLFLLNNGTSYLGAEATVIYQDHGSGGKIYGDLYADNGGGSAGYVQTDTGIALDTAFVVRLEVTNTRQTFSMKINGVLLQTYSFASSAPVCAVAGFSLRSGSTMNNISILRITSI